MARLFVSDDNGDPLVEIADDDDCYRADCRCGEQITHHREDDLIEAARIHVDQRHG